MPTSWMRITSGVDTFSRGLIPGVCWKVFDLVLANLFCQAWLRSATLLVDGV